MDKINLLIFDVDGTLVDSLCGATASVNVILARNGLPQVAARDVATYINHGGEHFISHAAATEDPAVIARLLSEFTQEYHDNCWAPPYEGVLETLEAVSYTHLVSMDISAFKSGRFDYVKEDLKPFVDLMEGRIMKMIYGATLLTEDEQKHAAEIAIELGIPFLKTNTGYGYVTTIEQVKLIKDNFGDDIKVMVSGGVRTKEDAIAMIEAGAARIATSSPFKIVDSFNA